MSDDNFERLRYFEVLLNSDSFFLNSSVASYFANFFRSEFGSEPFIKIIQAIAPKVYPPVEAKKFITSTTSSIDELITLSEGLQYEWPITIGSYCGHYSLDLANLKHQSILKRLFSKNNFDNSQLYHSFQISQSRENQDVRLLSLSNMISLTAYQTSPHCQNFRNVQLDGKCLSLETYSLDFLPKTGKLRFDFVSSYRCPFLFTSPLSNRNFDLIISCVSQVFEYPNSIRHGLQTRNKTQVSRVVNETRMRTASDMSASSAKSSASSSCSEKIDTILKPDFYDKLWSDFRASNWIAAKLNHMEHLLWQARACVVSQRVASGLKAGVVSFDDIVSNRYVSNHKFPYFNEFLLCIMYYVLFIMYLFIATFVSSNFWQPTYAVARGLPIHMADDPASNQDRTAFTTIPLPPSLIDNSSDNIELCKPFNECISFLNALLAFDVWFTVKQVRKLL